MRYSFQAEIASKYGIDEAILIENLAFWIKKNIANKKYFFEGRYWTYNSRKAFAELFPFWTERQIRRILKSLETKGAIYTGNFNKLNFDRTTWYVLDDDILEFYGVEIVRSEEESSDDEAKENGSEVEGGNEEDLVDDKKEDVQGMTELSNADDKNVTMHLTKQSVEKCPNGPISCAQTVQPIPYINTDSNTDINNNTIVTSGDDPPSPKRVSVPYDDIVNKYNQVCISLPKVQKLTDKRKKALRTLYKSLNDNIEQIYQIFEMANNSDFISGRSGIWTGCNIDWLINSNNAIKVLEGTITTRVNLVNK